MRPKDSRGPIAGRGVQYRSLTELQSTPPSDCIPCPLHLWRNKPLGTAHGRLSLTHRYCSLLGIICRTGKMPVTTGSTTAISTAPRLKLDVRGGQNQPRTEPVVIPQLGPEEAVNCNRIICCCSRRTKR